MEWFKMYTGWAAAVKSMTNEEAGQWLKDIYQYVCYGQEPNPEGRLAIFTSLAISRISEDMAVYADAVAKDQEKRKERSRKCRAAAKKRWEGQ